jgi:hypothetical protein
MVGQLSNVGAGVGTGVGTLVGAGVGAAVGAAERFAFVVLLPLVLFESIREGADTSSPSNSVSRIEYGSVIE